MRTPVEVLDQAIHTMLFSSRFPPRRGRPGEVIQALSKENRECLQELRSADIGPGFRRPDLLWL